MGAEDTSSNTMSDANAGITKDDICKKIAHKMNTEINIQRSVESIKSKVYDLIGRFKQAADSARNTGEGIKSTEGEESFREFMLGQFRYYYDLLDVLGSRHSINPLYHTDELKPDNSDSSDDLGKESGDDSNIEEDDESTSDSTSSTLHEVSTSTPHNEATTKTKPTAVELTTTRQRKTQKGGKSMKDAIKGFNANSAKGKSNTIIVGSGTKTNDMNEMLSAKKDLYKARLVKETITSNLASIKARKEAKNEDPSLTDEMLNLLFPLVYPPSKDSTSNITSS